MDIGNSVKNNVFLQIYIAVFEHFSWMHDYLLANPLIEVFGMTPSMHVFDTTMKATELRSKNPEVRKDMLEQWKEQLKNHPDRMDKIETVSAAVSDLGAASDTVSIVMQAFVYYMIHGTEMLRCFRKSLMKQTCPSCQPMRRH
jgi:hypothetical protein